MEAFGGEVSYWEYTGEDVDGDKTVLPFCGADLSWSMTGTSFTTSFSMMFSGEKDASITMSSGDTGTTLSSLIDSGEMDPSTDSGRMGCSTGGRDVETPSSDWR